MRRVLTSRRAPLSCGLLIRETGLMAMHEKKQKVRANFVYEDLKRRIINLEFAVGRQLVEETIALEYSISRTPVRQALQKLESENFVTIVPYVGCTVRQLTVSDIDEIYTIREALEGICAGRATALISDENIELIEKNVQADYDACLEGGDPGVNHPDDLLHVIVIDVGGNTRIKQIMTNLNEQARWCHNVSMTLPGRFKKSCREHLQILKAMKARNAAKAERLMREHMQSTKKDVINSFINSRFQHSQK